MYYEPSITLIYHQRYFTTIRTGKSSFTWNGTFNALWKGDIGVRLSFMRQPHVLTTPHQVQPNAKLSFESALHNMVKVIEQNVSVQCFLGTVDSNCLSQSLKCGHPVIHWCHTHSHYLSNYVLICKKVAHWWSGLVQLCAFMQIQFAWNSLVEPNSLFSKHHQRKRGHVQ